MIMTQPTTLLALLLAAAAASCSQVAAFAPPSALHHRHRSVVHSTTTTRNRRPAPLFVVADPPGREEEKRKHGGNNDDDDDDDNNDNAWVATSNGGFLPKIPRVLKEKLARPSSLSSPSSPPTTTNVPTEVLTIQEYKAVVAEERNQMVCVRFYAPWCKACKAVQQPFRKLCRENPTVKFVEVPLTKDNAFLHDGLGVPSMPYGHIYHPTAGLVEECKIKKKEFAAFAQTLENYVRGECQVEYPSNDDDVCRQK